MLIKINNCVIFDALFFFYLNYIFNIYISYDAHPWLYIIILWISIKFVTKNCGHFNFTKKRTLISTSSKLKACVLQYVKKFNKYEKTLKPWRTVLTSSASNLCWLTYRLITIYNHNQTNNPKYINNKELYS